MKQIKNTFKLKSHAKINLTFEVLGKKTKYLHEIIGVFQTIDLHDEILFKSSSSIKVECKNIEIPQKSNLVFHTILKLKENFNIKEGIHVEITKNIPVSSGFGGGSSNAALTLVTLNKLWNLNMSFQDMIDLGIQLGSDVPFFLVGGTSLISGVGDNIEKLPSKPPTPFLLSFFNHNRTNKTGNMYQMLNENHFTKGENTEKLVKNLHNREKFNSNNFFNIFNQIGGQIYPSFDERLNNLSKITGSNSFLSGSGPSMFSMFEKSEVPSNLKFPIFHTFSLGDEGSIK